MHDVSPVDAGARSDVDDPVGRADGVLVVFDHDQGVAEVAQRDEGFDQAAVVALVQADAGLVEHVEHAGEAGADLGGQADALGLSAGQGGSGAGEVEVVQADPDQEVEAHLDLAQHLRGNGCLPLGQLELVHEGPGVAEAQLADIRNARLVDAYGEHLGLQTGAVADRAGHLAEVFAPALALRVGFRLQVLPFDVRHDALEAGGVAHFAAVAVLPLDPDLEVVAAQDRVLHLVAQLAPRGVEGEVQVAGEPGKKLLVVLEQALALGRPRQHDAVGDAEFRVAEEEVGVDGHPGAEAGALGAGAERRVEGERARFDLGQLHRVVVRAGELLGVVLPGLVALAVDVVDLDQAVGELERGLQRVGQPAEQFGAGDETVDDDRNVVLELLLQGRRFVELDLGAVDDRAGVAPGRELLEQVDELALLLRDDRAEHLVSNAGLQLHQLVGDLLHGLRLDDLTANGAVRHADSRPEQAHVVVHLGDGADGGAGVPVGGLLVDGHGGAEALDEVDVRPVDLAEELPGVGGEGFHVPALALGEDRVERERRLAGAGQAREHDERIPRDVEVHVVEIVHTGTTNTELRTGRYLGN